MRRQRDPVDRLIDRLETRIDEITDRMIRAFVEQIPVYRSLSQAMLEDVRRIVRDNVVEWFRVVRERRPPRPEELEEFTDSARRRASEGLPLEALLHAYRLGATIGWEAILEESHDGSARDLAAALEVAGGLMRYLDHVSTAVAQNYLEEREHMVTDEERQHREIAERLLAEGCSSSEAEDRAARAGLKLAPGYWVALVALGEPGRAVRQVARRLREWPLPLPVIAVPQEEDVLTLWPANGGEPPAELAEAHAALVADHGPLLVALAGPAQEELGAALTEARAVLTFARGRAHGVVRLEDVPLDGLIHQAGGRTGEVVRGAVAPILEHDRRHGTGLTETLRTYVACNGSLRDTARALTVHRNTVAYRLERVRALTGLDPGAVPDLFLIYAGLRLSEDGAPRA